MPCLCGSPQSLQHHDDRLRLLLVRVGGFRRPQQVEGGRLEGRPTRDVMDGVQLQCRQASHGQRRGGEGGCLTCQALLPGFKCQLVAAIPIPLSLPTWVYPAYSRVRR